MGGLISMSSVLYERLSNGEFTDAAVKAMLKNYPVGTRLEIRDGPFAETWTKGEVVAVSKQGITVDTEHERMGRTSRLLNPLNDVFMHAGTGLRSAAEVRGVASK